MNSVLAIVVTYNRKEMLVRCLEALAAQTAPHDVLVVDNASTDGTSEAIKAHIANGVSYLSTGANLGGAGGFAFGIKEAADRGYESIWIMDDDVIPAPDALERLLEAEFFIWSDDLEWTRRVSRERSCYVIPASTVVHDIAGSAASNIAIDTAERIPRYFYAFRNEFYVYRREGIRGLAYYFAKVALNLCRIVSRANECRLPRLRTLWCGVFAGIAFKPTLLSQWNAQSR